MISLQSHLSVNTNIIEIYLVDKNPSMQANDKMLKRIKEKYKNWKTTKYISYHKNHLVYMYDLTDDNQIVFSKLCDTMPTWQDNICIVPYTYSKHPTYVFPCVDEIDHVNEYTLSEAKITNRVSIFIKTDRYGTYLYIEYKHSSQVDIEKIETIINNILQKDLRI